MARTFLPLLILALNVPASADPVCPFAASGAQTQRAFETDARSTEDALVSEMRKLKLSPLQERFALAGRRSMLDGEFKKAAAAFSSAAAADPANQTPDVFHLYADRAVAHIMLDEPAEALRDYNQAIAKTEEYVRLREGAINVATGRPLDLSVEKNLIAIYARERQKVCRSLARQGVQGSGCAE